MKVKIKIFNTTYLETVEDIEVAVAEFATGIGKENLINIETIGAHTMMISFRVWYWG